MCGGKRFRATPGLSNSFNVGTSQAHCVSRGVSLGRLRATIVVHIRSVESCISFHVVWLHQTGHPPRQTPYSTSIHRLDSCCSTTSTLASGRDCHSLALPFVLKLTAATSNNCQLARNHASGNENKGVDHTIYVSPFVSKVAYLFHGPRPKASHPQTCKAHSRPEVKHLAAALAPAIAH